ncbi:Protein mab-21-like 3, partial [Ophiophagus hannah]
MSSAVLSEQEKILQEFRAERVFLSGNKEWLVEKNFFVVKSTVERIVKWAYESSTGLYPFDPIPVGSYKEGLHLQVENTSNDFDFVIPIRYNPKLALRSRIVPNNSSSCPTHQLPTYIFRNKGIRNFPDKGLPAFCQGTKMLVDIEDVAETDVKIYCDKPKSALGEEEDEDDPEHCKLEMCQESLSHHNLDPEQILKDFHQYVGIALNPEYTHPRQNGNIRLETLNLRGPAIRLVFNEGNETIPVKLVPAVQGAIEFSNEWMREDLTHLSDWWDGDLTNEKKSFLLKVQALKEVGLELVPKGGFWRLSFSCAEEMILKEVDADGGQRRAALRLLKFVNQTRWTPEYGKILTSYHLKTILLWSCEIYPRREAWETLLSSLKTLLGLLKHTLVEKCLPHYFLKPLNLFNKHYKTSNDIYWPLSLETLAHEVSAMLADATAYLVLSQKSPGYSANQGYEEKTAALQEFKESHREELEELKRMEDEHMYEEVETTEE